MGNSLVEEAAGHLETSRPAAPRSQVPEPLRGEVPRVAAEQLRDGAHDARLDHEHEVVLVADVEPSEALDRHAVEDHATVRAVDLPAVDALVGDAAGGQPRDLEPHVAQLLRPE